MHYLNEELTKQQIKDLDKKQFKTVLVKGFVKEKKLVDDGKGKKIEKDFDVYKRDILVAVELTKEEKEKALLMDSVRKTQKENPDKVVSVQGNDETGLEIVLEDSIKKEISEPTGATQEEIDAIDYTTHKVIYFNAGLANGDVVQLPKIVELSDIEKKEILIKSLKDKIEKGEATQAEVDQYKFLVI